MGKASQEVNYTSADGRFRVTFAADDQQSLFEQLASFQEIFEDDSNVVIDGVEVPASDIKYRVRTAKDKEGKTNEFYEKVYGGSNPKLYGYKMEYGSSQESKGSLFPRRKDKDGNYYKNGGWHKWEGQKNETDESPAEVPAKSTKSKTDKAPF